MDLAEVNHIRTALRHNFASMDIRDIQKLGEGMRSSAYLVNRETVFRFPKEESGARDTEKEMRILPSLKRYLSLHVPEFSYFGKLENGYPFVGYRLVSGVPLGENGFQDLSKEEKSRVAEQVAAFIGQLRTFSLVEAKSLSVPERNFCAYYTDLLHDIEEHIFPHIQMELQAYLLARFTWYLGDAKHFQYVPVLLHADLSCDHLLFDAEKGQLTGVIDFGDMMLGDPVYEYIYLLEECGQDFTVAVMEELQEKDIPSRLTRLSFFLTADAAAYGLEGLKRDNKEMIEEGIALLQEEISERGVQDD